MGYKEKEIINNVLLEGSKKGRLFRVNAGSSYQGTDIKKLKIGKKESGILKGMINSLISFLKKISIKYKDILILINPRFVKGLPAGVHDVIGWEVKTLCEIIDISDFDIYDKNGNDLCDRHCINCLFNKKIAVFKAVEVKTGKQQLSEKQENFKRQVLESGGIYEERRD